LLTLPAAWRRLPGKRASGDEDAQGGQARAPRALDPVGIALLGAAVIVLLIPLVEAQQWSGWAKWLMIPGALILLVGFAAWEWRQREPAVDLRLFTRESFSFGTALALCYFAGFTALFFAFTLYLQNGLGRSALIAGLASTPFAVGSAVAAAVGGRLVESAGRTRVAIGLAGVAIGLGGTPIAVHAVGGTDVGWYTAAPLLLAGLGSGLIIAPNQTIALSEVPVREASTATRAASRKRGGSCAGCAGRTRTSTPRRTRYARSHSGAPATANCSPRRYAPL
jgi:hypothetical protein